MIIYYHCTSDNVFSNPRPMTHTETLLHYPQDWEVLVCVIQSDAYHLLTEVCHDVMVEPYLQPLTGEVMANATSNSSEGARLDIAVNGFWGGCFEKTFLDVRLFNPHAPLNNSITGSMRTKRSELMNKEFGMLNTHPSLR